MLLTVIALQFLFWWISNHPVVGWIMVMHLHTHGSCFVINPLYF